MRNIYVAINYVGSPTQTRTFSLTPDDTGEGRLMSPLTFTASVRTWVQNESTRSSVGDVKICNADGELDSFVDEEFIDIEISEDIDGSTTQLAYSLIDRVVFDGDRNIVIKMKDALKLLDKPIQSTLFPASETSITGSGTNTYYALENQPEPICWGVSTRSVKPVLAKRSNNEYIVHDEDVYNIIAVYDNGTSVSFSHHNKGFTLLTDPAGIIVADIQGQELPDNSNRIFEFDDVVEYMLDIRESIPYNSTDAGNINTDKNYRYGYYQDNNTNRTIREVLQWHVDSHTGWFYADETGEIRFGYLQEPAVSADVDISQYDVVNGINVFDDTAPNITTIMGGNRNWYVYDPDDIAAGVSAANRTDLSQQWRDTYQGVNTLDSFYTDTGKVHDGLVIGTNTQAEIDNVTDLYSQKRKFYAFTSTVSAEIGETVELTYPRYNLTSGVNLLVVGKEIDFINNVYKLTLWG